MSEKFSEISLTNKIVLLIFGLAILALYIGVQIQPHPDFLNSQKSGWFKRAPSRAIAPPPPLDLASFGLGYDLPNTVQKAAIPEMFTDSMPTDIGLYSVQDRKQLFVRLMLPLIVEANDKILAERALLLDADAKLLDKMGKSYRIKTDSMSMDEIRAELDKRIRPIPVSLALAQAAIESGWGTSRFTQQANALFGQWAWRKEDGIKPLDASNSRAVIKKFDNLLASVVSYMKNLNSHYAYADFRDYRATVYRSGRAPSGLDLVVHMSRYAEIGHEYVETIRTVIIRNKFANFNKLTLEN